MAKLRPPCVVGIASLLLTGCFGAGDFQVSDTETDTLLPDAPGAVGAPREPATPDEGMAFSVQKNQVSLIPFQIRLDKVAHVLGVTPEHPALGDLRTNRFELGDHDFANGIIPDRSWTASRLALWVKSLRSVCGSAEFKARYPALPEGLDALIVDAYGRHSTSEDVLAVSEVLSGLNLDDAAKAQATCLSVLSATEFVSR